MNDDDFVPSSSERPSKGNENSVTLTTRIEENKLRGWHTIEAQYNESKLVRDQVKQQLRLKMRAQYELLEQKVGTALDVGKKAIFNQYLADVAEIETEFMKKLDVLERQNDEYLKNERTNIFKFFDEAEKELEQWKSKPTRYESELELMDDQREKRLGNVKKRIDLLEKKRESLVEQTLKVFETESDLDKIKKKFNIFDNDDDGQ